MQTSLWPAHGMVKLGTTFGLIAAAVCPISLPELAELIYSSVDTVLFPIWCMSASFHNGRIEYKLSYRHDMAKPRQADRVVEVAYAIAMIVNVIVSVSGYLMYGTGVSDEVRPNTHEK